MTLAERRALRRLIDEIACGDLYDLQERYGLLFDRTRSLSLHLFEHVHGESRDRGQAMVDLLALYEKAGLKATAAELRALAPAVQVAFLVIIEPSHMMQVVVVVVVVFVLFGQQLHVISHQQIQEL